MSDHSLISLTVVLNQVKCGKGLWKLNTSLLNDPKFLQKINSVIDETIATVYKNTCDVKWEKMKQNIITNAIEYSIQKAKENKTNYSQLVQHVKCLQQKLCETESIRDIKEIYSEIERKKLIIEKYENAKIKGTIVRTRTRRYAEGQKNTAYFLGLEKTK